MRNIFLKTAVAGFLCLGLGSCADDLNISSIDPQSSPSYDADGLLAKQYATLGLTGQTGPSGNGDMSQDEGESGFYRVMFNLEELCTDECIWAWQTDTDIPAITNIAWNSSSVRCNWAYQRLAYDIHYFNLHSFPPKIKALTAPASTVSAFLFYRLIFPNSVLLKPLTF